MATTTMLILTNTAPAAELNKMPILYNTSAAKGKVTSL